MAENVEQLQYKPGDHVIVKLAYKKSWPAEVYDPEKVEMPGFSTKAPVLVYMYGLNKFIWISVKKIVGPYKRQYFQDTENIARNEGLRKAVGYVEERLVELHGFTAKEDVPQSPAKFSPLPNLRKRGAAGSSREVEEKRSKQIMQNATSAPDGPKDGQGKSGDECFRETIHVCSPIDFSSLGLCSAISLAGQNVGPRCTTKKIGLIGFGIKNMVLMKHLLRAGIAVTKIFSSRCAEKSSTLAGIRVELVTRVKEVMDASDLIVVGLGDGTLKQAFYGRDGIVNTMHGGQIIVNAIPAIRAVTEHLAEDIRKKGGEYLELALLDGTLACSCHWESFIFMCAGKKDVFDTFRQCFVGSSARIFFTEVFGQPFEHRLKFGSSR